MQKKIKFGQWELGVDKEPVFLPDIGTFFNQNMYLAKEMVEKLATFNVGVMKGEILHNIDICLKEAGEERYFGRNSKQVHSEDYRSLIDRKVVPLDKYEKIFTYSRDLNIELVLSVYDFEGADFAVDMGSIALKIASSNITHQPLIEYLSRTNLPIIFDTGHSTMEEISRAVNWSRDAGATEIIVEHSPLPPPSSVEIHNLNFMQTMGRALGVAYGLSDHHYDDEMLYAATSMGACILEKGVCPDNMGDEQDGGHALSISRVPLVMEKIRNIHLAMGSGIRDLARNRKKYNSRMGIVAKANLEAGAEINLDNVSFAFPIKGVAVEYWQEVAGRRLLKSVEAGQPICWENVTDLAS